MSEDKKYAVPEGTKGDVAVEIVKAAISAAPVVGGPAAELFSLVISPPLEKRRVQWMEEVADGLKKLEETLEGFSIENLKGNERFISTVLNASQSAMRDHQREKRDALRNAVLNVARGSGFAEDVEAIFLFLIDHYTPWHLRILRLFQNPLELGKEKGLTPDKYYTGSRSKLLEHYYPEMRGQQQFYGIVVADLRANGMLGADLGGMITSNGMFQKLTTDWADQFLAFITSPI
jgi:hypothetical protein